ICVPPVGQDGSSTPMPQSPAGDVRGFNRLWGDDPDGAPAPAAAPALSPGVSALARADGDFHKWRPFDERSLFATSNGGEMSLPTDSNAEESTKGLPLHLPKRQLELFLRIQKQQRDAIAASVSQSQTCNEAVDRTQEQGCSSDEDDTLSNIMETITKKAIKL
ncbi:Uncharacterized protein GBIM_16578, partial [Gryllus bimaculatus]